MTTYLVFTRQKTNDQLKLNEYYDVAAHVGGKFKPLAMYGEQAVLEGPDVEGVAIISFENKEEALAWYHGDGYSAARKLRLQGADYTAVMVEGL